MSRDIVAGVIQFMSGLKRVARESCPDSPAVYFANHSSHLDFVIIWAALPANIRARTRPVAGRDYWEQNALRRRIAGRFFRAVLIERQRVTVASNPLAPMIAALDAGDSLIVFPEGTRSPDGNTHEFKSGPFHVAHNRPQVPLVPVYLQNLNGILPSAFARLRGGEVAAYA